MNTIFLKQKEIIENFKLFDEWEDKYEYLLDFSKNQSSISDELKINDNLVKGCNSKVWVVEKIEHDLIYFLSDSESPIPRGLAALISTILSGNSVQNVLNTEISFHKETNLINYLSPTRTKGLESMIVKFKNLALKHRTDINSI